MKKTKWIICLALVLALVVACGLVGCEEETCTTHVDSDGDNICDVCQTELNVENDEGDNGEGETPVTKVNYTVTVKTQGGMPLVGINVYAYSDSSKESLIAYATTNSAGTATISMVASNTAVVELDKKVASNGYLAEDYYSFTGLKCDIVLTSKVIENESLTNVNYKLGDIIRDFEVSTIVPTGTSKKFRLSEVLEDKEMVLINFWYTTCTYCVQEFPYMNTVYQDYDEKVAIIALNPNSGDSVYAIKQFINENGLVFDVAQDKFGLATAFNVTGYPTSVVVDRYGAICLIEEGGILSEKPFIAMFDHFTGDNYEQKLFTSLDELTPIEIPNIEMEDSATIQSALNANSITVTFRPETGTSDAEYSWPFVTTEKDGVACIKASNAKKDSSFATLHADVTLTAGQAISIEYLSSTEKDYDVMYILVDGKDVYAISGNDKTEWEVCYPFVAIEDGEYTISFIYVKDSSTDTDDDTVYLKNLAITNADAVSVETYIPRYCATNPREDGSGYDNYVNVVYNETDGYYHVGTANGPLVLANLMGYTNFSKNESVYTFAKAGLIEKENVNYYDEIITYCNYASNSIEYGLCTVNSRLKELLVIVTDCVGLEDEENEWLQLCQYYDAYGTNGVEMADPIKGIAPFSAYDTVVSETGDQSFPNSVTYSRVIMPRGYWNKFVPTVSGAYRIITDSSAEVDGWIFDADGNQILTYDHVERFYNDVNNVNMVMYFEAGETYYIDVAFWDVYHEGTIKFRIEYLGATYDYFRYASSGAFTTKVDEEGNITNTIIAGGIDVELDDDGYYRELKSDGTLGSYIYADFTMALTIMGTNLMTVIEKGGFDFSKTELDQEGLAYLAQHGEDGLREQLGDDYDAFVEEYQLEDLIAGIYHGNGQDLTEEITAIADTMYNDENCEDENLYGCVKVNERLGEILQQLMDKYTFANVKNSWTKLCYYYDYLGTETESEIEE